MLALLSLPTLVTTSLLPFIIALTIANSISVDVYMNYNEWKTAMDDQSFSVVYNDFSPILDGEKKDHVKLRKGNTDVGHFDINLSGEWLENWIWTDKYDHVRYEGRYTNENRQLSLSFDNFGETGRACGFAGIWKQYYSERGEIVVEVSSNGNKQKIDVASADGYDYAVNDDKNDNSNNDLPWGSLSESQEDVNLFEDTPAYPETQNTEKNDEEVNVSELLSRQNEQFIGFVVREGFEELKFTTSDRVTLFDLYDVRLSVDCRNNSPTVSPAPTLSPLPTGQPTTERVAVVYTDYNQWKKAMDARGFTIIDNDLSPLLDGSKKDYLKLKKGSTNVGYFDINLGGNRLDNWIWTDKDDKESVRYEGRYSSQRDVDLSFDNFGGDGGRAYGFAGVWKQYSDYQRGDLSFEVMVDGEDKNGVEDDGIVVVNDDDSNDMPWGMIVAMDVNHSHRNLRKDKENGMVNVGELLTEESEQFVGIVAPNGFEELRFVRINDLTCFNLHDIKLSVSRETSDPTPTPSGAPSSAPSSSAPSSSPSASPSNTPSLSPSGSPSGSPSNTPSQSPSTMPTVTLVPSTSISPSSVPTTSAAPSSIPSELPSFAPTVSFSPSFVPSTAPSTSTVPSFPPSLSVAPSDSPSLTPSIAPSLSPSISIVPSTNPTIFPSFSLAPSDHPTTDPTQTLSPSSSPSASPSESPPMEIIMDFVEAIVIRLLEIFLELLGG